MSFGCSVGDIILLSQLSLQIYRTVTSGRKSASRDLEELTDVLFGFRCALDHLCNVAGSISETASSSDLNGPHGSDIHNRLDQMVRNFATTLEDLDSVTKKYRDGAQPDGQGSGGLQESSNANLRVKLQRRLASNVMRIRWDIDKSALRIYRDKLQSHTDVINLVLNTYIWSNTQKIRTDNEANAARIAVLYDNMAASNSQVVELMKDILAAGNSGDLRIKSENVVAAHYAIGGIARRSPGVVTNQAPTQRPSINTNRSSIPSDIEDLNAKRMGCVPKVLVQSQKPAEVVLAKKSTTVAEVMRELDEILPKAQGMASNSYFQAEIARWTRKVDELLEARVEAVSPMQQNQDLVDILLRLNETLANASTATRTQFYESSGATKLEPVLGKIPAITRSVRARKELADFEEAREEWEETR